MEIFQNDSQALQIGALTIENGLESIVISGDVQIDKTAQGKEQAKALYEFASNLWQTFETLEKQKQLLAEPAKPEESEAVDNPFG